MHFPGSHKTEAQQQAAETQRAQTLRLDAVNQGLQDIIANTEFNRVLGLDGMAILGSLAGTLSLDEIAKLRQWDDAKRDEEQRLLHEALDAPISAETYNKYLERQAKTARESHQEQDENAGVFLDMAVLCLGGFAKARNWDEDRLQTELPQLVSFVTGKSPEDIQTTQHTSANDEIAAARQRIVDFVQANASDNGMASAETSQAIPNGPAVPVSSVPDAVPVPATGNSEAQTNDANRDRKFNRLFRGVGATALTAMAVAGFKFSQKHELQGVPKALVAVGTIAVAGAAMVYTFGRDQLKARFQK